MSNQCDVFISYSRRDYVDCNSVIIPNNILSKIKDTLTQNGLTYWFDEEGIYSGQEFTSVITKAIREAKVLLFVSSRNSNASEWTSNEIAIAKRLNKPIIPFCLDDSPYNDSVMMMIASLDYIDVLLSAKSQKCTIYHPGVLRNRTSGLSFPKVSPP